ILNNALYEQKMKFRIISVNDYEIIYTVDNKIDTVKGKFEEELEDPAHPQMRILVTRKKNISSAIGPGQNQANYLIQPHRIDDLTKNFLARLTVENPDYT